MDLCQRSLLVLLTAAIKRGLAQSGSFPVELLLSTAESFCLSQSEPHVGARYCVSRGVTAVCGSGLLRGPTAPPTGPLQDGYNSSPREDAIAGIPTRNRDTFAQGTDTLAAARQSIHQSPGGSGICKRPQQALLRARFLEGTGPLGLTPRLTPL